ncbi:undecaprenyl-phosphate galactose phosphotransferase WbaP [Telmatospirillum sp. J64-1]|uniref:undecaprenyl-phosphate galactose phosphotransferase WbaP n=1 Tax=Telmatospirillum sp. J64-1 TaxID=2502183 RepID=UPI00163D51FF|nr:undecaprenyl-phosphate galactose phosphotransferase WbaP [Telmatospirillum sp. J64-1]
MQTGWAEAACRRTIIAADLFSVAACLLLVRNSLSQASLIWYNFEEGTAVPFDTRIDPFLPMALGCLLYFRLIGLYTRRRPLWDELRPITKAFTIVGLIDAALLFASGHAGAVVVVALSWLSLLIAIPLFRQGARFLLTRFNLWRIPTVIIGARDNARQTAAALKAEGTLGLEVKCLVQVGDDEQDCPACIDGMPVVSMSPALLERLCHPHGPHVVVALEENQNAQAADLMRMLAMRPNAIDVVPPVRGMPLYGLEVNHLLARELLLLRVRNNLARRAPRLMKRLLDIVGASVLIALLSPVLLLISLLVLRTGRPVLYGHERIGEHGRPFRCLKFRSMVINSEQILQDLLARDPAARAEWELNYKLYDDPRITDIGRFLRRTSLDELPQLFNVLRGEMSLVGPRPIVASELQRYGADTSYYLLVKPGITGLWQVSGRQEVDYPHRVFLDAWYVKNWSLWYDISILFRTAGVVLKRQGAY